MLSKYRKSASKGTSLTEMSVVLALVSIVSLLVTSFTVMVHTRSMTATTKNRVADDLRLCKIVLETWLDEAVNTHGAETAISADGKNIIVTIDGTPYATELTEDSFKAALPDEKILQCPIGEIKELHFEELKREDGGQVRDAIWFCTVKYLLPQNEGEPLEEEITFTVNLHVGDTAQ